MSCNGCVRVSETQEDEELEVAIHVLLQWATLAGWARIDGEEFCPECAVKQAHRLESAGGRGGADHLG